MMQLEVAGQRYSIAAGELIVGTAPDCTLALAGEDVRPRHAIVQGLPDGSAVIRRAGPDAEVLVCCAVSVAQTTSKRPRTTRRT